LGSRLGKAPSGRLLLQGRGCGEPIAARLREPPPLAVSRVPELPTVVDAILQRCLCKDPGERFQSMVELEQALAHAEYTLQHASMPTMALGYAPTTPMPTPMPDLRG